MKLRMRFLCFVAALVSTAIFAFASPVAVNPIPANEAQDLLIQMENGQLVTPKAGVPGQVLPLMAARTEDHFQNHLEMMANSFERPAGRQFVADPLVTYERYSLSMSNRWHSPLDLPACSVVTAPDTSLSYFAGIMAGDAYKVWFNPADCPGCNPVYPFRLDSLKILVVQDGGSPIDTVFIGIDVECARFDPTDPCQGPGQERCFNAYFIPLPADTDTLLQVFTITLPFDSCWIDGPGFIGLWHLGHTLSDNIAFHPSIAFDGANAPPVQDCYAWTNLLGTWQSWASTWVDPDPGYPVVTIYGECNTTPPAPIVPCPAACAQTRYGTPSLAYYDPTATAVWEWFGVDAPDLSFPYKPTTIDFSLYYPIAGAADDSVQVLVTYGCRRFQDVCCAPSDVLCAGTIWLVRGNGAAGTLLPVSLDLSSLSCCLQEDFWVGAIITGVGAGDSIPSFLWTSTANDPNAVPPCEEWVFDGSYNHWPNGTEAWADFVLSGSCGDCQGDPDNNCSPFVPEQLDCSNATTVQCGVTTLTGQTNAGTNNVNEYCCAPWDESGPEKVYSINVPDGHYLSVALSNISGGDVDVFLLSACDPASCVASGDVSLNGENLSAGIYYVVVDGFGGDVATYDITLTCFFPCPSTTCRASLLAGTQSTNSRYLDGEWDATLAGRADTVYYQYYPGTGTLQYILKWSATTCDTFRRIAWTSVDASTGRMLAADPRGYFWTGTITNFTTGTGRLYRVGPTGTVLSSWTAIAGLPFMRWSGCAFDPDHNHLWVFIRDSLGGTIADGLDRAYELDVTAPTAPVVIQGPHYIQNPTPYIRYSTGGADYAQFADRILLMNQGTPNDYIQCLKDSVPSYAGPPPGPGLVSVSWCPPDSNLLQGFGLAAVDNIGSGKLQLTNFTDGNPPHPINTYDSPCPLFQCLPVTDARIYFDTGSLVLYWTAPQTGQYRIYMTTNKNNDGNPDGGADPNFGPPVATVNAAAGPATWTAPNINDAYRNYVIVTNCQ